MEPRPLLELLELADQRDSWNKQAGKTLREARLAADLSQSELASLAGTTQPYVSSAEAGHGVSTDTLRSFHSVIAAHVPTTGGSNASTNTATAKGRRQKEVKRPQARTKQKA